MSENAVDITDIESLVDARDKLAEQISQYQNALDEIDAVIKEHIGDCELGLVRGMPAFSWKHEKRSRFDAKRFRAENPQVVQPYLVTSEVRKFVRLRHE